jgi:hypothetical protein
MQFYRMDQNPTSGLTRENIEMRTDGNLRRFWTFLTIGGTALWYNVGSKYLSHFVAWTVSRFFGTFSSAQN